MSSQVKIINILGVTGSVGQAAADVIAANSALFKVNIVTAHENSEKLAEISGKLQAQKTVLTSEQNLEEALQEPVDITLCAIAGMAGLSSMMQAIEISKAVAIANKEPLVAAGPLVIEAAKKHKTQLLPVDSEHNAIFQVFDRENAETIEKIILTASGGPFLNWSRDRTLKATPEQALAHPNWSMGKKISIDSATMMNKALEIIEAHYLFNMPPEKIEVLIHPQSIVHSMVEYCDGSVLAQLGASDMRTPIANVLAWPDRAKTPGSRLNLKEMKNFTFEKADLHQFPALKMAYECLKSGAHGCIAMNAANEVAVDAFLAKTIRFLDIIDCVGHILGCVEEGQLGSVDQIQEFDKKIRVMTHEYINKTTTSMASAI